MTNAVAQLYDQTQSGWLPGAVGGVLGELRQVTPRTADGDDELHARAPLAADTPAGQFESP